MRVYNEDALAEVLEMLRSKPRSISELATHFDCSERTIKRWFSELQTRGHRVVRDGVAVNSPFMVVS